MTLLYDAYGREVYEGGLLRDDIRDAIQAAARADDFELAHEIAERYGWKNVCLYCAEVTVPIEQFNIRGRTVDLNWPLCAPCKEKLDPTPDFSDVKFYAHGLIKRSVV